MFASSCTGHYLFIDLYLKREFWFHDCSQFAILRKMRKDSESNFHFFPFFWVPRELLSGIHCALLDNPNR